MATNFTLLRGLCLLMSYFYLFVGDVVADAVSTLQNNGRAALNAQLAKSTTCTAATLQVRKEWYSSSSNNKNSELMVIHRGDLAAADRLAYIAAVKCLMTKPSQLPAGQFPGAHNPYVDFVVVHMQQTPTIHATVHSSQIFYLDEADKQQGNCKGPLHLVLISLLVERQVT